MSSRKRKADTASQAESADESPYKQARSESTNDTANKQNVNPQFFEDSPDNHTKLSTSVAKPPSKESEAAPLEDLPPTWDQASAADKILVELKQENTKQTWAKIQERWEQSTGEKAAKEMLSDRYKRLRDIMVHSKGAVRGKPKLKVVKEPLETPDQISTLSTTKVRSPSPVNSGPPDKSPRAVSRHSKTTTTTSDIASAAPEAAPDEDLPQSWEQANAADQLIVKMKTSRISYAKIEDAWQQLTGEKPAEGAMRDRYMSLRKLVTPPDINGASRARYPVKASTIDGAPDQAESRRAKSPLRMSKKRKAEAESSEESLDESSVESSDESSYESPKHSIPMARRKPSELAENQVKASAFDGQSDGPISKRKKITAKVASDDKAPAESSNELDEVSSQSLRVAKSAKRPRVKIAVAANLEAQNTMDTANEMVVEMKERGCDWVEISKAWTELTGKPSAPETTRKRYARIKKGSATEPKPITPALSKERIKSASSDEGSYESTRKRSKLTAETPRVTETPIKRNMDRGKRKTSVKYTESTTDEDELFAAPIEPIVTASAKRNAGRAAKVNRSDPQWLVTNEKSPLAYEDLHAEFSDPKTYEKFTKSDWEDLRETLPPNVPIDDDGYSIPMTFFKYDPDFRRGIREFQEDLATGRLDPGWQADAAQAMEERAQGEFDAFKEDQFEAFWGQKQKLQWDVHAGESGKIKLDMMIESGVFKVGDYFSFSRVFGRGKNGVLVEKDCKIVKVDGKTLTFAIPPGQRKYIRSMFESGTSGDIRSETEATMAGGDVPPSAAADSKCNGIKAKVDTETYGGEGQQVSDKGDGGDGGDRTVTTTEMAENGSLLGTESEKAEVLAVSKLDNGTGKCTHPEANKTEAKAKPQEDETNEARISDGDKEGGAIEQTNGGGQSPMANAHEDDVLLTISVLMQLQSKIVDIDGRYNSKDMPIANAWRQFRGIRNNQDLGTLFEMREAFYVREHPQIVKEPKRKR